MQAEQQFNRKPLNDAIRQGQIALKSFWLPASFFHDSIFGKKM